MDKPLAAVSGSSRSCTPPVTVTDTVPPPGTEPEDLVTGRSLLKDLSFMVDEAVTAPTPSDNLFGHVSLGLKDDDQDDACFVVTVEPEVQPQPVSQDICSAEAPLPAPPAPTAGSPVLLADNSPSSSTATTIMTAAARTTTAATSSTTTATSCAPADPCGTRPHGSFHRRTATRASRELLHTSRDRLSRTPERQVYLGACMQICRYCGDVLSSGETLLETVLQAVRRHMRRCHPELYQRMEELEKKGHLGGKKWKRDDGQ